MKRFCTWLPDRFQWVIHNIFAHPLMEVLFQLGFEEAGNRVHNATIPDYVPGQAGEQ